jgi:hypothetical protein
MITDGINGRKISTANGVVGVARGGSARRKRKRRRKRKLPLQARNGGNTESSATATFTRKRRNSELGSSKTVK